MNKFITRTLAYYDAKCVVLHEPIDKSESPFSITEETVKVWETDPNNAKRFFEDAVDVVEMEFKGATLIKILEHSETKNVVKVKMPLSMFTFFGEIVEAEAEEAKEFWEEAEE